MQLAHKFSSLAEWQGIEPLMALNTASPLEQTEEKLWGNVSQSTELRHLCINNTKNKHD
jgi:hypothetical protein